MMTTSAHARGKSACMVRLDGVAFRCVIPIVEGNVCERAHVFLRQKICSCVTSFFLFLPGNAWFSLIFPPSVLTWKFERKLAARRAFPKVCPRSFSRCHVEFFTPEENRSRTEERKNWQKIGIESESLCPAGISTVTVLFFFPWKHGNNVGSSKTFKRRFVYVGKVSLYCRHRQDWKRIISTNTCCFVFVRVRAMRKRGAKKYGNDTTRSEGWKRGWRGDTKKSGKTLPSVE